MSQWEYRLERLGPLLTDFDIRMRQMHRRIGPALGKTDDDTDDYSAVDQLNQLGSDGWELVAILPDEGNGVAFFKRKAG